MAAALVATRLELGDQMSFQRHGGGVWGGGRRKRSQHSLTPRDAMLGDFTGLCFMT